MGNITQLFRDHLKMHVGALFATYSGNQLVKVFDGGVQNTDYDYPNYPDLADEEQEYFYDSNGNQIANLDKDLVTVRYNCLNLPDTVQFGNGNRIIHYYLSGGERIRTVSRTYTTALSVPLDVVTVRSDPHIESVETRLGSLIYTNGTPDRLLCQEGYWEIQKNSASGVQEFHPFAYICDYLGSVRLVCDGITGSVVQSLEYLPSGLICSSLNYDLQPNKFTGKELLSMHGLNQYDSKARMQEFQLPGFTTQDLLCEEFYDWTPYGYCMGNPINRIDPDGRAAQIPPILPGMNPVFISSNPIMATGRMLGTADKVVRALPKEKHHIIPRSLKGNNVVKGARQGGFKLDGKENKIPVDKFSKATGEGQHGKHTNYTDKIENRLNDFKKETPNFTPEQAANAVRNIVDKAKSAIENNPGTKVNDLRFEQVLPVDNLKVDKPIIFKYVDP